MNRLRRISFLLITLTALIATLFFSDGSIFMSLEAKDTFVEEAWGQAGSIAYQAAAKTMRSRNGQSYPLSNSQKRYLRRYFIDLIDRVSVVYSATMMDQWVVGGRAVRFGSVESAAQTYCDRIYLRDAYKPDDPIQLMILAHEMVHARQCEQLGGFDQFGYRYFIEFRRAGQIYVRNKMEKEAYDLQKRFAKTL
ncbi:hypothetical protein V2H45_15100 [Tumidithrix elongata RA019]|uniref:DUF4157 domain-containing protein n=1 Tax=Tumidithrix elongata BACA0141 TaxID=2716417 RepID=A0AAW9PYD0_9CYAN|nr:hypothetical protein [Tumidithrix elongata RA019]